MARPPAVEAWHAIAANKNASALDGLIAADARFLSPVVHTPQVGKAIVVKYLSAALEVLGNETFKYRGEWIGENSAVLEFETVVDGIVLNGVDIITWNADHKITEFKVMVRPLKAIHLLHQLMASMLQKMEPAA